MKTIKFYIVIVLFLSAFFATAQEQKKISLGLLGGVNIQNLYGKDTYGRKLGNELILGFHAGANIQILIAREFYFQPGLMFSTKGREKCHYSKVTTYQTTPTATSKTAPAATTTTTIFSKNIKTTNLSYIELPLNIVYKTSLGRGYLMFGLGPYVGYAIIGRELTRVNGESQRKKIEFSNDVEANDPLLKVNYKAFDAGGNIFFGGELAGIFAQLNVQVGMVNINSDNKGLTDDKSIAKNTGFAFSLGYRF